MSTENPSLETTSDTAGTLPRSDIKELIDVEKIAQEIARLTFGAYHPNTEGERQELIQNVVIILNRHLVALKAGGSPSLSDGVKKDSGQRQDSTEVAAGGDGGPAFPSAPIASATDDRSEQRDGMSLRDWFAGQALIGFLSHPDTKMDPDDFAELTDFMRTGPFKIADAMLGARTRKGADKVSNVVTQSQEQAEDEAAWKAFQAEQGQELGVFSEAVFLAGRASLRKGKQE